ncbi:MAG: phosphoribosylformylglycinamidine synthase, partial [Clostridia bacterium]|nr:phosphoribosylformylglycinamidine synthase [Clostridia bacterium]
MVYRIYVEKKPGLENEAAALKNELCGMLGMAQVKNVRLFNRYDAEGITEEVWKEAVRTVLSEPQLDNVTTVLPNDGGRVFATEYLPGQFDQRADSAAQCIQIMS